MKEITAKELAEKVKKGEEVNIIDVREDDEVAAGKIPGARHIRLGDIPDSFDKLNKNEHYYMVCRSGGRSGKACEILKSEGFDVTNMTGGMLAWEDEVEVEG
ncbi:rhodanese-like domain-containing protein [Ornithinibacillus halophilus]|uniref:Rhodanese-related sulfurtransferase n=1 Tax=Ornithinibacillus halophilus TaxID=930117 RepID=A0A1M5F6E2_9BACI|nr:rhodanese-like domain-containing protein [Ornithinibacillus halophilus]SHF86661.1 Rhodanese-related sulfurtransferase [Ornithinibacillus halophilus]